MSVERNERVVRFVQKIVEELTPAITEAVEKDASGHFRIEFAKGEYQRGRKDLPL